MRRRCLICGVMLYGPGHICDPKLLARIDTKAEQDPDDAEPKEASEVERMEEGFLIQGLSGDDTGDDD